MARRPSMGRQKIDTTKKIEKKSSLQVTFCKRRTGLYKKANELAIACGAQSAIIVFSPANKPYSAGYPNVNNVVNRFLTGNASMPEDNGDDELKRQYAIGVKQLEEEKKKGEELRRLRNDVEGMLEGSIDGLNFGQLDELYRWMDRTMQNVVQCEVFVDNSVQMNAWNAMPPVQIDQEFFHNY